MSDPLTNATYRLRQPLSEPTGTNSLSRTHEELVTLPRRCSLRQLSAEQVQSVFGVHQVEGYRFRAVTTTHIPPGAMLEIRQDGRGAQWQEYRVQTARRVGRATNLLVTRV